MSWWNPLSWGGAAEPGAAEQGVQLPFEVDYLFEAPARGGYFVIAKAAGFPWGPGELDGRVFRLVRTRKLLADAAALKRRHVALAEPLQAVGGNLYRDCTLRQTDVAERLVDVVPQED